MSCGERTNTKSHIRRRLWRWRSNPLRRHDDVIEAWIVLSVWTVMTLGGALVGAVTAQAADGYFAGQRAEMRSVRAVLVQYESQAVSVAKTSSRIRAKVR